MLKEAGYPNGFKTKMMSGNRRGVRDVLTAVQQDLKKVGIDTDLEFYDEGKYFLALIKGWKNGLLEYGQNVPVNFTEELCGLFKKGAPRLPCLFRPIELQEILTRAEKVPDYGTQKTLVKNAVRMMSDMAVVIPLYTQAVINVMYKTVRDPGFNAAARGQWTPENVWLSK